MAASLPVLDLDSLVDRPVVVLNGQEYWLVTADILPPLKGHQLVRGIKRINVLAEKDVLTEDESAELALLPDTLCRLILMAPEETHQGLDDYKRCLILEKALTTFRSALRVLPAPQGETATPAPTLSTSSTGGNGSPD